MSTQYTLVETVPTKLASSPSTPKSAVRNFSWGPYLELVRLSKPAGLLGVIFPYVIGFLYSVNVTKPTAFSPSTCGRLIVIFILDSGLIEDLSRADVVVTSKAVEEELGLEGMLRLGHGNWLF